VDVLSNENSFSGKKELSTQLSSSQVSAKSQEFSFKADTPGTFYYNNKFISYI